MACSLVLCSVFFSQPDDIWPRNSETTNYHPNDFLNFNFEEIIKLLASKLTDFLIPICLPGLSYLLRFWNPKARLSFVTEIFYQRFSDAATLPLCIQKDCLNSITCALSFFCRLTLPKRWKKYLKHLKKFPSEFSNFYALLIFFSVFFAFAFSPQTPSLSCSSFYLPPSCTLPLNLLLS